MIAPAPLGGAEQVVVDLAASWNHNGGRAEVLLLLDPDASEPSIVSALKQAGVLAHTVSSRSREVRALRHIQQHMRALRPDILHTHGYKADALGLIAARRAGMPIVSTVHGFTRGDLKNRIYEWIERLCLKRMDGVITVSKGLKEFLVRKGVPAQWLTHVSNACLPPPLLPRREARALLGIDTEGAVIGWIGRLSPEKGPDVFVQAVHEISSPFELAVMVGDGVEAKTLREMGAQQTQGSKIRFAGLIPNASRLLAAFDVLVISSRTEGLPMVLLEAMHAQVPVVATGVGEIPHVLGGGEYGWLVEPGNVRGLASQIAAVLSERERASAVARSAKRHVSTEYDSDGWVARIREVYAISLARRRTP